MLATVYIRFQHLPDSKARYFRGRRLSLRPQEQRALRGKMSFSSTRIKMIACVTEQWRHPAGIHDQGAAHSGLDPAD